MYKECDSGNNLIGNFFTCSVMTDAIKHLSCTYLAHQELESSISLLILVLRLLLLLLLLL